MALPFSNLSHFFSQQLRGLQDLVFQEKCPSERVGPYPTSASLQDPATSANKAAGGRKQIKA